jgi:hypothetical protein
VSFFPQLEPSRMAWAEYRFQLMAGRWSIRLPRVVGRQLHFSKACVLIAHGRGYGHEDNAHI